MSSNKKDPEGLPNLNSLDQERFRLADITSAHVARLSEGYEGGPSIVEIAAGLDQKRHAAAIESLGEMAPAILEDFELEHVPWDPNDAGTTFCMSRELYDTPQGIVSIPAIYFERRVNVPPKQATDSGLSQVVSVLEYTTVPMAEITEDGSLKPAEGLEEADLMIGQDMVRELEDAGRDTGPDGLPNLSPDLTTIVDPKIMELFRQSGIE